MTGARFTFWRLSTSVAALCLPAMAQAQSASEILPPTREEVTRENQQPAATQAPRVETEGAVERAPCALDAPQFKNIRLTVRQVEFVGLKGMTPAQLASSYQQYVGVDQPVSVVCAIRDRASAMLRDAGYVAAIQVPEQSIENGVVRFNVLMAHMGQVRIRGNAAGAERVLARYMDALTSQEVFNKFQAERYLLLASDIPGYSVRLTLRPAGTTPGEVIGDVTVQHTPVYVDANVQNYGSDALGPWGGLVRGQVFGLTGLGDRTMLSLYSTSDFHEQQTIQLGHDFRLGGEGLAISDMFTYSVARPDVTGNANVRSTTLFNTFAVDYPLRRKLTFTARLGGGLDFVNQNVRFNGDPFTRDKLRVAFLHLTTDRISKDFSRSYTSLAEPFWRLSSQMELRKGLSILGATDYCGKLGAKCNVPGYVGPVRIEGVPTAWVFRSSTVAELRPARHFTLGLNLRSQRSWKPLHSFEEFSVGNYTTGRGYAPGTLIGDNGFGSQFELRYGSRIPRSEKKPAIEGYAFWDYARVKNHDRLTVVDQSNHLQSIGAGARVGFDRFALDAVLAIPLTKVGLDNERPDPRFLISLTSRLWPWSYR